VVGKTSSRPKASLGGYLSETLKADPENLARAQAERTAESRLMEMQRMIGANSVSYQETGRRGQYTDFVNSMADYAKKNGIWYDDTLVSLGHPAYKYVLDLNCSLGRTDLITAKTASEEYGPEVVKGGKVDFDSILYKELGKAESAIEKEQGAKLREQYPFISEGKLKAAAEKSAEPVISKIKSETEGASGSPFITYSLIKQSLAGSPLHAAVVSGYREELEREISAYQKGAEEKMKDEYASAQRRAQRAERTTAQQRRQEASAQSQQNQKQQPFDINQLLGQLGGGNGKEEQEPERQQKRKTH